MITLANIFLVLEVRRLLGQKFDDEQVQQNLPNLSYTVVNKQNEPVISISHPDPYCSFEKTPVQVCTLLLEEIKNNVERHLGKIKKVKTVITVPAYFNLNQRTAILEAAQAAGFKVLKLLNESTAIVLRYNFQQEQNQNILQLLIYDLGGSTFNVTVLKTNAGNIETVAVAKDIFLGGRNFDDLLVSLVCNTLKKKYNFDPSLDKVIFRRLQNECEQAKIRLSSSEETLINLDPIISHTDIDEIKITQKQFEKMAQHLFKKTIHMVDECLKSNFLLKKNIKQVVLSGGSTKMPKVQKLLAHYFGNGKIYKFNNTNNCVAEGAALEAAMLSKHTTQELSMTRTFDVTPLSIGISIDLNVMDIIIPRNTRIPCKITKTYLTIENNQKICKFDIYTGERVNCKFNRLLGTLQLENLTPVPPRKNKILLTMTIEETGILRVSAKEELNSEEKELQISYIKGHISDGEIQKILKDAELQKDQDSSFIQFALQKQCTMNYLQTMMHYIRTKGMDHTFAVGNSYELCRKSYIKAYKMEMSDEEELMKLLTETIKKCAHIIQ